MIEQILSFVGGKEYSKKEIGLCSHLRLHVSGRESDIGG